MANAEEILQGLIAAAQPEASERWLEAACGPGALSRRLAPLVRSVHGVDCFAINEHDGHRVLTLRMWLGRWRR